MISELTLIIALEIVKNKKRKKMLEDMLEEIIKLDIEKTKRISGEHSVAVIS